MRAQLHAERPALERLLARAERGASSAVEAGILARQLRHFSFVEHVPVTLRDEQELVDRYKTAIDQLSRDDAQRSDSITNLIATIARELNPSFRMLDGTIIASCDEVEQRVNRARLSLNRNDRDALAGLLERKSSALLTAVVERARDAYAAVDSLIMDRGYSHVRAYATANAYGAALVRIESRARALHRLAIDLRVQQDTSQSPTTLIVGASSLSSLERLEKTLAQSGKIIRFKHIPYFAVMTDALTASDVLARTTALGHDARVYRERVYSVSPIPSVRLTDDQWNLELVHAPQAWEQSRGKNATVAVIDTGIDYLHRDLAARFTEERGANFADYGDPLDDNGHGTHVAGIVAGERTGVAPEASLYAVKVLNGDGYGTETAVLQGMEWAIDKNVDVINMSLGSSYPSSAEKELVAIAAEQSISVACAAGNSGDTRYEYPACYPGATSVAAVDSTKRRAHFSTRNDEVDVAAPGVAIYSCFPNDGYESLSGTSMATPHIAGAFALLASRGFKERETALLRSAERLGPRDEYGAGLLDCVAALHSNQNYRR
jgi:hypothetical protein